MPKTTIIQLRPLRNFPEEWDRIEDEIKAYFKDALYIPLLKEFYTKSKALKNAKKGGLYWALQSGRITFHRGTFSGKFDATISKELKRLGAKWDRKSGTFKATLENLPDEARFAISSSADAFNRKLQAIDRHLDNISPNGLVDAMSFEKMFDKTIWKTDSHFRENVKNISLMPKLSDEAKRRIASEWAENLKLHIKDWLPKHILELRQDMQKTVLAGNRFEAAIFTIQKSYRVSANKAKFLARQETKLLTTKLQETRYADAGVKEYTWHSVAGTAAHPVRPRHKALNDMKGPDSKKKIFRFDDPPVTSEPGEPQRKNNPGADFNCRCQARPVVRFQK